MLVIVIDFMLIIMILIDLALRLPSELPKIRVNPRKSAEQTQSVDRALRSAMVRPKRRSRSLLIRVGDKTSIMIMSGSRIMRR